MGVKIPVFVACEEELAILDDALTQTLQGQGNVVFFLGEAGAGKSHPFEEFINRVQSRPEEEHRAVIAAARGDALPEVPTPYLAFPGIDCCVPEQRPTRPAGLRDFRC